MLLGDTSWNIFAFNTLGVTGDDQYSGNGGSTWTDQGAAVALGAFDVLSNDSSVPEPGARLLMGTGLIGFLAARRQLYKR